MPHGTLRGLPSGRGSTDGAAGDHATERLSRGCLSDRLGKVELFQFCVKVSARLCKSGRGLPCARVRWPERLGP
eukprot:9178258-Pyramimonas_sp.AAC.1